MTKVPKQSRVAIVLRAGLWAAVLLSSLISGWASWQVARKVTKLESEVYLLRVVPMPGGFIAPQGLETPDGQMLPFPVQRF